MKETVKLRTKCTRSHPGPSAAEVDVDDTFSENLSVHRYNNTNVSHDGRRTFEVTSSV